MIFHVLGILKTNEEVPENELVIKPIPVTIAVCGLGFPEEVSATESTALRLPADTGVKVALIWQLAPPAIVLPQLLVWEKSPGLEPVKLMELMVALVVPVLDNVKVNG